MGRLRNAEYKTLRPREYRGGRGLRQRRVFTRRFRRAGLDVYGVDASGEMLSAAARTAREEGLDITYIMQDIRAFRAKNKLHFITALTDCVNYLNGEDMKKTFRRFSDALARGGAFIFDISSEYKLREIIADNMFGEDCDDYAYLWFNRPFDGGVEMDITYFKRLENGLFERSEERHVQYVHTVQSVSAALDGAGFELVKTEGHLGEKLSDKSERINFIAIKR